MPYLAFVLMIAGATGAGSLAVQASGIRRTMTTAEDVVISFVLGASLLGWLAFFPGIAGHYDSAMLAAIAALPLIGLAPLWLAARERAARPAPGRPGAVELALIGAAGVAMLFDLAEALSPPVDADTIAYHFATPQMFLAEGVISFIPRAIDGAIPLLQQTGYGIALALGNERTATLWTMATGWASVAVMYLVLRRGVERPWALAGALVFATTPAVIYGSGSGQVEVRTAGLTIVAAFAVSQAMTREEGGWALIAGLGAGFFMGSKFPGLLIAFGCGLCLLTTSSRWRDVTIFTFAALAAGSQWYLFNFAHSGDPLFPMLWGIVDYPAGFPWNDAQAARMQLAFGPQENPVAKDLLGLVVYPFVATLDPLPAMDSGRVGLGIGWLVLLPFAVGGAIVHRRRIGRSPMLALVVVCAVYYIIWFLFGPSQRVRHLLPVLPLFLICAVTASARLAQGFQEIRPALFMGFSGLIVLQLAGQAIFSQTFVRYLAPDATREDFLVRNINGYGAVRWLNEHLETSDKVLVMERQWLFYLRVPRFYANPNLQAEIEIRPDNRDIGHFALQVRAQGITHIAVAESELKANEEGSAAFLISGLARMKCITEVARIDTVTFGSRTFSKATGMRAPYLIYAMDYTNCTATGSERQ